MNRVTLGIYVSRFPSIRVVSFILEFTPVAVLSIFFFFLTDITESLKITLKCIITCVDFV